MSMRLYGAGARGAKGDKGDPGTQTSRVVNFVLGADVTGLNQTSLTNIPELTFTFTSATTAGKAVLFRTSTPSLTGTGTFSLQTRVVAPSGATVYTLKLTGATSAIGILLGEIGTYTVYTDYICTGSAAGAFRALTVPTSSNSTTGEYFAISVAIADT